MKFAHRCPGMQCQGSISKRDIRQYMSSKDSQSKAVPGIDLESIEATLASRYTDRITTIDSHTQGEPTRLLVSGVGVLPGKTIRDKRNHFEAHFDQIRKLLTSEPRGHRGVIAAVLTEPVSPEGHFGLFYMDARRYLHLCGHATIGAVASLVASGVIPAAKDEDTVITVDTPSGPMEVHTRIRGGSVESVAMDMVPSFVFATDRTLAVEGFGRISADLVCVGGFFAMVNAESVGIDLVPQNSHRLINLGMAIIKAANQTLSVHHPGRPEVNTVDVTEFHDYDPLTKSGRSVVIYGEAHMDRSPCGTGTTAKMTLLHHQGKLAPGQVYKNSGPLGTVFEGRIVKTVPIGNFKGIVGRIRGNAQITGFHQFTLDGSDPFPQGFML